MRVHLVFSVLLAGCIDTDPAVFVDPSIGAPSLTVETTALVTALSGGFSLALHLGPRAASPSTTGVSAASLVGEDGAVTLAPTLGFTSLPTLPTTVPVDDTVTVQVTLALQDNLLPADATSTICGRNVKIRALVEDSLRGVPVTIDSAPFTVGGCN